MGLGFDAFKMCIWGFLAASACFVLWVVEYGNCMADFAAMLGKNYSVIMAAVFGQE